ncbi:hypothetical protein AVEN_260431-1 [Araneus ventricosus]|uniref:Uncharacterized protein n=1 Tax=Araneus ventricosus TaxID=182803 RepID=A0A4Y2SNJ0_ARAVE|nr:hypothetical protein AVEN_260431-1 [Araneus ventricosus]
MVMRSGVDYPHMYLGCLLYDRHDNSAHQVVLMTAVAVGTDYRRRNPFRVGRCLFRFVTLPDLVPHEMERATAEKQTRRDAVHMQNSALKYTTYI